MRAIAFLAVSAVGLFAQEERIFIESLARLERRDPAARKDLEKGSPIRFAAMSLDPAKSHPKSCMAAATWLWATNMMTGFSYGNDQSFLQATRSQPDLLKAWSLLQTMGEKYANQTNGIQLEIGWRLLDLDRMRSAYDAVSTKGASNIRELVHCYFVSAHLGDWARMKKYAQQLVAQGGKLDGFHVAAENTLTMFDYESLLKAVESYQPPLSQDPLFVRSHRISRWRVRVQNFSGSQKDLIQAAASWPKGWTEKPDSMVDLLQVGAAAHWVEGFSQPPVSGVIDKTRIYLVGYRDSKGGSGDSGRQEQVWDMRSDASAPGKWRGINTLTARLAGADPKAEPAFHVVFEVEWDLATREEFPETIKANPPTPEKSAS